jgi:hypothetical protein
MLAWQIYAHDNNDTLVPMLQGSAAKGGLPVPVYGLGWIAGYMDWTIDPNKVLPPRPLRFSEKHFQMPGR